MWPLLPPDTRRGGGVVTDSRLSAEPCSHLCCQGTDQPGHMHLFGPEECLDCRRVESKHNHPSRARARDEEFLL